MVVVVLSDVICKVAGHDRVMDSLTAQVREPTNHPPSIRCLTRGVVLVRALVSPEPCKGVEGIKQIGGRGRCVKEIGGTGCFGQATYMAPDSVFVNLSDSDGHMLILGLASCNKLRSDPKWAFGNARSCHWLACALLQESVNPSSWRYVFKAEQVSLA